MKSIRPHWVVVLSVIVFVLDLGTKRWALAVLERGETIHLLGGILPITLAFNTGMVFGITIYGIGRGAVLAITVVILALLFTLLRRGHPEDPYRSWGVGLAAGGSLGNLYDRLRWTGGVVDFLGPIDLGFMLWPIFNLADIAIVTGALLVAASFGWEERVAEEGGANLTS